MKREPSCEEARIGTAPTNSPLRDQYGACRSATPGRYVNSPVFASKSYSLASSLAGAALVSLSMLSKNACEPSGDAYTYDGYSRSSTASAVGAFTGRGPCGADAGRPSTFSSSWSCETKTVRCVPSGAVSRTYSSGTHPPGSDSVHDPSGAPGSGLRKNTREPSLETSLPKSAAVVLAPASAWAAPVAPNGLNCPSGRTPAAESPVPECHSYRPSAYLRRPRVPSGEAYGARDASC